MTSPGALADLEAAARAVAELFDGDGQGGCYLNVVLPASTAPTCMAFVPPDSAVLVRRLWETLGIDMDGVHPETPGESVTDQQPVVTVIGNSPDGTMVRWHHTPDDARNMRAVLIATREGVLVYEFLTEIPDEWVAAAKAAHRALVAGADVSHLATHRTRFPGNSGPLEPVTPEARES